MKVFILQSWNEQGQRWDIVSVHAEEWTVIDAKREAETEFPGRYDIGEWEVKA